MSNFKQVRDVINGGTMLVPSKNLPITQHEAQELLNVISDLDLSQHSRCDLYNRLERIVKEGV